MKMKQQLYRDERDVYDTGLKALTNNKPSKDYINYLTLFTNDELTTGKVNKPANYAAQRAKLIKVMQHKYLDHGFRQTISKLDFDSAQFHELLFAMHFITHEIEITNNIGYDKGEIAPGIYRAKPIAYIEYKIVDKNLMDDIKRRSTSAVMASTPTPPTGIVFSWEGRVHKDGRLVLVTITGDDTYAIKKLSEDGTYDKFMDYILNNKNADIDISIKEIKAIVGLHAVSNLSLLARYSGFIKPFKQAFFPTSKKDKIRFRRVATLSNEQVEAIKTQSKKV